MNQQSNFRSEFHNVEDVPFPGNARLVEKERDGFEKGCISEESFPAHQPVLPGEFVSLGESSLCEGDLLGESASLSETARLPETAPLLDGAPPFPIPPDSPDYAADVLVEASLCFYELCRKVVLARKPKGIATKTQMDVLVVLHSKGSQSMSGISRRLSIAPEQATRAVDSLKKKGFVQCERDEHNRRMVIASLTPEGNILLSENQKTLRKQARAYLDAIPAEIRDRLIAASESAFRAFRDLEESVRQGT